MSVVTYESKNEIAVITLNRPEKMNALSVELGEELRAAWQRFQSGDDKVAILTGAGDRAFSAGADLTQQVDIWRFAPGVGVDVDKPIIAAVNGICIGGAAVLVQFCDLCIMADDAKFTYPEAKIGISGGLITSIVERMPHKVAMEFMFGLKDMSAERAYEVGFVNKVVPQDQLMAEAMQMAGELCNLAPMVLSMIKRFVGRTLDKGPTEIAGIARRESEVLRESYDFQEGVASFREKRLPKFENR
jgi:enoyl-CoA hydratase/carnithine racemase